MIDKTWFRAGATQMVASGLAAWALTSDGQAQESIRPSLTGATAAESRSRTFRSKPNYNLKAGPVVFDLRGGLGLEFNDNINLSDDNREADFIIRPTILLDSFWQVTPLNALTLDLGISYAKYLDNQGLDSSTILIAPNSQLSFDIFIGDFRINLHDRFSIVQDPIDEIELSNVSDFTRFQNTAGISALWDLNDVKIVLGYDHYTFRAISGDFSFLDRSEEQVTFSAGISVSDATSFGVDAGAGFVNYNEDFNNDAVSFQVGPFYETQVSNYLKVRVSAGYQVIEFDSGGSNDDQSDHEGPFAVVTLAHRFNAYLTETLSAGYETRLGLTSNSLELAFARYTASWRLNRSINLNFDAFFEDSHESGGVFSEDAQRYGAGFAFDYQLTKKLLVGLRYQFSIKDSDLDDRDYYQNRVLLNFEYDF